MDDKVTVYLMDSGINHLHPEFEDVTIENLYSYDDSFEDNTGHGTGVASVIVGKTLGLSSSIKLKIVKIGIDSEITIGKFLEAFNAILMDSSDKVSIVNCSWAIPKNDILESKLLELYNRNFLIIAAAGNHYSPAHEYFPVSSEYVLSVGACDMYNQVRNWSTTAGTNWGPEISVTSYGIEVPVATLQNTIEIASGTSLATARVTQLAAEYIKKFPEKNAKEIKELIISDSVHNILIRDEEIYKNTPNRLVGKPIDKYI
jgi:subtilisin family serine protease